MARLKQTARKPVESRREDVKSAAKVEKKPKRTTAKKKVCIDIDSDDDDDAPVSKNVLGVAAKDTKDESSQVIGHETKEDRSLEASLQKSKPDEVKAEASSPPHSLENFSKEDVVSSEPKISPPDSKKQHNATPSTMPVNIKLDPGAVDAFTTEKALQKRTPKFEAETLARGAELRSRKQAPTDIASDDTKLATCSPEPSQDNREEDLTHESEAFAAKHHPVADSTEQSAPVAMGSTTQTPTEVPSQDFIMMNRVEHEEIAVAPAAMAIDNKPAEEAQKHVQIGGSEDATDAASASANAEDQKHKGPTLTDRIFQAVEAANKKGFTTGDVATIVDAGDLSKALLLSSDQLFRASPLLRKLAASSPSDWIHWNGPIRFVYLLKAVGDATAMPVLVPIDPGQTWESFSKSAQEPCSQASSPRSEDVEAIEVTPSKSLAKVKKEEGDIEDTTNPLRTADLECKPPPTDWLKTYESFFSIITGVSYRRIFDKDASTALPQIEAILAIAKNLEAVEALSNTFNRLWLAYIGDQSLWKAISERPASWLLISLSTENSIIFTEAFTHLAGRYPDWPEEDEGIDEFPKETITAIDTESRRLQNLRDKIDLGLLTRSLATEVKSQGKAGDYELKYVGQHHEPTIYNVVNLWRDWICEHVAYINSDENNVRGKVITLPVSLTCEHKNRECSTVAGFYRTISKGGDAYLPADEVLNTWNRKNFKCEGEEGKIRTNLAVLEAKAAEMVSPLAKSNLQYAEKDKLDYLTCVEVKREDMPWAREDDE